MWDSVGSTVKDPDLQKDLKSLAWMHRRLAISKDDTVQILLRLPSLLHPSLKELKDQVRLAAADAIRQWASERGMTLEAKVNVEAIALKPKPAMASTEEEENDIATLLGPGLANVAHFLVVYSCKVGTTQVL